MRLSGKCIRVCTILVVVIDLQGVNIKDFILFKTVIVLLKFRALNGFVFALPLFAFFYVTAGNDERQQGE